MKKTKKKTFINGVAFLALGAFISKALGALYRIPLTNMLGGEGLGLYQMVFPVYALLLDFSGAGVPGAISRLIAKEGENDRTEKAYNYLVSSIRLLIVFGLIGTLAMLLLSRPLSNLQGTPEAFRGYIYLSPAVFVVSLISSYRGYFQGLMNMGPTAVSQIIEQVVKLLFGLLFVSLLSFNTSFAVAGATFAITLSEIIALTYLIITYYVNKKRYNLVFSFNKKNFKSYAKNIVKTTLPITLIGIMLPLSHVIDSFLTVNILSVYREDATSLYGIFGGAVMTVINLPVAICYGVATVAIPSVSASKTEQESQKNSAKALLITFLVALPCVVLLLIFAPFIVNLLFKNLMMEERKVAINLLRITSPCVLTLSFLQTANATLIGKGKLYYPIISLLVGVLVKILIIILLLRIPSINIYGNAIALNACYFTVCLINLIMIFSSRFKNVYTQTYNRQPTG